MSHFIGLVFVDANSNYETMLEPFDEQTENEDYIEFVDCTDELKDRFEKLPKVSKDGHMPDKHKFPTIDALAEEWYGYHKNEEGKWGYRTNPLAKWDWYSEGGRWQGFIKRDDGENCDSAPFTEIDWDSMLTDEHAPFCFVSADGEWHEKGEMGWWAMVANEKEPKDWLTEFKDYVQSIKEEENEGDDIYVYAIDFHI